jgi:hypothetical protein
MDNVVKRHCTVNIAVERLMMVLKRRRVALQLDSELYT